MTYLIFDTLTRLTKIGKTKNFTKRMSTLSTSNLNLKLIFTTNLEIEKLLHKIYKDKKIAKEWYKLSKKDIEDIEEFIDQIEKN